jgi:hypothetical protein
MLTHTEAVSQMLSTPRLNLHARILAKQILSRIASILIVEVESESGA